MPATAIDAIDGLTTSVAVKAPCEVASLSDILLSGEQTIEGAALTEGDRVLVTAQTDPVENGIYRVSTGTWQRAADFDGNRDVVRGTLIPVYGAGITSDLYEVLSSNPITIGSSSITFSLRYGATPRIDRTQVEITAEVFPAEYRYEEGDDRRYASVVDWLKIASAGVEAHLYTDHTSAVPLDLTGDAVIKGHGRRYIRATAPMPYLLRHSGELSIDASVELLLDGNNQVTFDVFHSTATAPRLRNVRLANGVAGWLTGPSVISQQYGLTGHAVLENVIAENCANAGFSPRGNRTLASQAATVTYINCETRGTTGSGNLDDAGVGYVMLNAGFLDAQVIGGRFTGHSSARCTSGYACSNASVDGGLYHDISRGPTMGEETTNFSITNTRSVNISDNAVSADTTTGVGSTVGVGILANNVAHNCGRAIRTTCSNVSVTGNRAYECTSAGAAFAFGGTGSDVWVDGNTDYSATLSRVSYYVLEGTTARFGVNHTNSNARTAYLVETDSLALFTAAAGVTRTMTANGDLSAADKCVVLDCTANTVDLDLFSSAEVRATGFEVLVLKADSLFGATLTFQGGAIHGETVNGATSLVLPAAQKYRGVHLICIDGAAGTWIATPVMPATIYTVTNPTADRTYDADAAAVAETNDVLATLLLDLGLR